MAGAFNTSFILLIVLTVVSAAPSDIKSFKDLIKSNRNDYDAVTDNMHDFRYFFPKERLRQKRSKDYYDYEYPSNGLYYSRDRASSNDFYNYGMDDFFTRLHQRFEALSSYIRQISRFQIPIYYPIFIPNGDCNCIPNANVPQFTPTEKEKDLETTTHIPVVSNDSETGNRNSEPSPDDYEDYGDSDGSRPISFDPILQKRPGSRPAPPVDHGSEQQETIASATTEAAKNDEVTVPVAVVT